LLNVNSNQLNQSKIKNIEDGAKGSGSFFIFFYCKRRSGACCVVAASSHAPELTAATQLASELKSSEACCVVGFSCSKLRSRTSSGACCVATSKLSHSGAEKLRSLLRCSKQALTLRSLLLQRSKLSRFGACCCNAASSHAPEPKSSEVCCVAAASFHAPELAAAL